MQPEQLFLPGQGREEAPQAGEQALEASEVVVAETGSPGRPG